MNASSELAAEVACPMKLASGKACWRRGQLPDSFLQISCSHGSVVLLLVMLGGTRWGSMREPHPQSLVRQSRSLSPFFHPGKLPKHSKVSLLPKTSGLHCAKLLSPAICSPLTLSKMPGSRPCVVWEKSLQMGLLSVCALKLDWDEESSELARWWAMWKKLSNHTVTTSSQESASESESDVNEQQGDINPPFANTHLDWMNLQRAYTSFQEIPSSCVLSFFFKNIKISLHISRFSNSFMWNLTTIARNLCWALLQLALKYILHNYQGIVSLGLASLFPFCNSPPPLLLFLENAFSFTSRVVSTMTPAADN